MDDDVRSIEKDERGDVRRDLYHLELTRGDDASAAHSRTSASVLVRLREVLT